MRQDYDVFAAAHVRRLVARYRPDVLHAQHSTAHAVALMAAWGLRSPVFAVTRRVVFPLGQNIFSRLKYLTKRINGYVAISNAVKEILVRAGVSPARVEVIPSVTDEPGDSPPNQQSLFGELGLTAGRPLITNVANYADFKGQKLLAGGCSRGRQTISGDFKSCSWAGNGENAAARSKDESPSRCPAGGFRTDVPRLLAASDIFVLPSLQEAAGTALLEAMSAGLPCIGTQVGGIPEILTHGQTGLLVPPADAKAISNAIVQLLENPDQARSLAERGQSFVRDNFGLVAASKKMEAFYERLLSAS